MRTDPTAAILALGLLAQLRREFPPDMLLFGGALALVLVDAGRWRGRVSSARPPGAGGLGRNGVLLLVVVASLMALPTSDSGWRDLAFAVVGLAALLLALLPGRAPGGPARPVGTVPPRWWVWPGVALTLAMVELYSFLHQQAPRVDSPDHPSISTLVEPGLAVWWVRAPALWLWLLGGLWLVRRIRAWGS